MKGKLRSGRQFAILVYLAELLCQIQPVLEWTLPLSAAEIAKKTGPADSDAVRDVRGVMEDLCQRGIVARRPADIRGDYQYKLLIDRWNEAPVYTPKKVAK